MGLLTTLLKWLTSLFLWYGGVTSSLVVNTDYGPVMGVQTDTANMFLGVPYAKPPVGPLRWQPPQSPMPWKPSVYNASSLKPGCPQHGCLTSNPAFVCPSETSESCLFLNIWTPRDALTKSYPVMVYLHGGNFVHMSASSPIFKGDYFAANGKVVLVTLDYRLGAFGFLFTGFKDSDAKGNYGILDQRLALQWVQQNIRPFGGDPTKVTLFGQSAGAQSSSIHLISPKSAGLFNNVIMESSPFDIPFKTPVEAAYLASTIKTLLNCTDDAYMACLRSKTADEVAEAQLKSRNKPTSLKLLEFFEPLGPLVDGDIVPMEPTKAIQNKRAIDVPVMVGTVSEEARIFVYIAWGKPLTVAEFIAVMFATYPSHINEILKMYPPTGLTDTRDLLTRLGTDFIFTCVTRNMSRNLMTHKSDVYRYVFDHAFSFKPWGNFSFCDGHVCHGEEIAYVFHSADQSGFNFDSAEETLSNQMIAYWTNFAYSDDPNKGPHSVDVMWPTYDSGSESMVIKTPKFETTTEYLKEFCDFWDSIGYKA